MNKLSTDCEFQNFYEISESYSLKKWLTNISRIIKPPEGLSALLDVIASVNTAIGEVFISAQEVSHIHVFLKHTVSIISFADLFGDMQWWICQEARNKQERAGMLCFTALKCARASLFLLELSKC